MIGDLHTGVSHVQKSACGIPLNTHVIRPCHPRQWNQSTRFGDLGLIFVMSGKICDAPDSVALDFDIRAQHLANQWLQST